MQEAHFLKRSQMQEGAKDPLIGSPAPSIAERLTRPHFGAGLEGFQSLAINGPHDHVDTA